MLKINHCIPKRVDVVKVKLVREKSFLSLQNVGSPEEAHQLLRKFIQFELDREYFLLLCLDTKNRPTTIQVIAVGTLDSVLIHPREVYKTAILANAASIICAHCHPSGDPEPSPEDLKITRRLMRTGTIIGISLLDHLILGTDNNYISFKETGLMELQNPPNSGK
ncbi:DNA repair protein RadC [Cohnella faecalis]|uniref:DNA repair protein RadC n=2 Tax=Cohnella faecalis TaxID=2315694 RepID=A0A398CEU4_9BACL|nr:DNA repair protein RadC [Cohnella faecalis]